MTLEFGNWGEQRAKFWLEFHGFQILDTNYRSGKAEIDIVAMEGAVLVVVEVKTRTGSYFDYPENSVGVSKQKLLARAAANYMHAHNLVCPLRFDIVAIEKNYFSTRLLHFRDAFFTQIED
jgi:putative endonuclease